MSFQTSVDKFHCSLKIVEKFGFVFFLFYTLLFGCDDGLTVENSQIHPVDVNSGI